MPASRRLAAIAAVALYVGALRCQGVSSHFLLLGDQIRDWTIALGAWHELPLTGAPSVAGGRGLGPIYYWVLWAGRHLIGPLTGNLPHAGGLTLALLQTAADAWLVAALWTRLGPALAIATALTVATAPFDVALSSTIWNPQLAVALGKGAMALLLTTPPRPPTWRVALPAVAAWLAVQAHGTGVFVAAPVLAALVWRPLADRDYRASARVLGVVAAAIGALQVPMVIAHWRQPGGEIGPTLLIDSLGRAANLPGAFERVTTLAGWLITTHDEWPFAWPMLGLLALVWWRWRRDAAMLAVTLGPVVTATLLFAGWTRPYDSYWFLPVAPAVAVAGAAAVAVPDRKRLSLAVGLTALALVAAWQPARREAATRYFRFPHYGALASGSRTAARRTPALRDLRVGFPVEPSTDVTFLYRILGGRLDAAAPFDATIHADGTVTFAPAR